MSLCGYTMADLELATVPKGIRPAGTPLEGFSEADLKRIIGAWDIIRKGIDKRKGANNA